MFWSTPVMTAAQLVFAIATTAYILIAIQFEEHNLVQSLGDYAEYRRRVPMLVPMGSSKQPARVVARQSNFGVVEVVNAQMPG
jgi:hypothetical protein